MGCLAVSDSDSLRASAEEMPALDGSANSEKARPTLQVREDRLSRFAYRIMERLQGSRARLLKTIVPSALQGIVHRSGAAEAHLFRIRTNADGYRTGSLRYSSSSRRFDALEQFPVQLFSERLLECLLEDHSAIVKADNPHLGGPLIEGIMKQTQCEAYLLCPLIVKDQLKGILGVATQDTDVFETGIRQLLKFNGMSLFWVIRNTRREARQRRRFREWKHLADQACEMAFTIDESRVIKRALSPGRATSIEHLEGRFLTELVDPPFHTELILAVSRGINKAAVRTANFRMTTGQEESRWYAARIDPSHQAPNSVTLFITYNDEDQSRQEELRALQAQLRKTERL
jgi:hypothetical protein